MAMDTVHWCNELNVQLAEAPARVTVAFVLGFEPAKMILTVDPLFKMGVSVSIVKTFAVNGYTTMDAADAKLEPMMFVALTLNV